MSTICCGGVPSYMSDALVEHYKNQHWGLPNTASNFYELQMKAMQTIQSQPVQDTFDEPPSSSYARNFKEVWCLKEGIRPTLVFPTLTPDRVTDESARKCFEIMDVIDNFLLTKFQRRFLSKRKKMVAYIRDNNCNNNVYWSGSEEIVRVGTVHAQFFKPFETNLDMIAHEFMHGIIQYNAKLPYEGQSGALNESIADAYMIMIKHCEQNTDADAENANWFFGDGLLLGAETGDALRSLRAPGEAYINHDVIKSDPQVSHMSNYIKTIKDYGGVHYNSGIPNHAFYLAATQIGGKIWERTGQIWDQAMAATQGDDFSTFALRTLNIAQSSYGDAISNLVGQAWERVGVDLRGIIPQSAPTRTPQHEQEPSSVNQSAFFDDQLDQPKTRKGCCGLL